MLYINKKLVNVEFEFVSQIMPMDDLKMVARTNPYIFSIGFRQQTKCCHAAWTHCGEHNLPIP